MNKFFLSSVLIFFFSYSISAQTLSGQIKNEKDSSAIPGVLVYIPDVKLSATSDAEGFYTINNVPRGTYLIEVKHLGYKVLIREIEVGLSTSINFLMKESNMEMKEVIVTGVNSATEKQTTPIPIGIVHQKDFLQSSSTNIIDALTNVPGVSQITEGPAISKPVIRGLGYNRVVVVNDGVRQEGQQWGDEFGIEVDEYTVNKVEIYKGPSSLRYGSDAMAGVINMLAALPLEEGKVKGSILSNYQSNTGLFAESFNLAGNIKGFIWDVRYTNKEAHDYKNKYDGYVWNSGYAESDLKGMIGINRKWGYSHIIVSDYDLKLGIVEGTRDSATGNFTRHVLGSDQSDSLAVAPQQAFTLYNYFPLIHQHVRHYKAVWDNSIAIGTGRLGVRLGYQQNYRQEANDITVGDVYNNSFYLRTTTYDIRYVFAEKKQFELSFGANGMQQQSQDRGTVFLIPEYNLFDIGLYSIAKKTIDRFSISGGIRYDARILHGNDLYTDSNGVRTNAPDQYSSRRFAAYKSDFSGVSASLGATYDFSKYVYGKINVSRGYRAPTAAESGSNGIHDGTPFYEIGDPNLKPESSLQFDATLGVNTENISIEVNGFVNEINNYIFPVKLQSKSGGDSIRTDVVAHMSGPAFKYISGDAVLSGGEALLDIHPSTIKWLHFINSFSVINAIQKNQGDSTKYLPYTPPYKLHSELKFSFDRENKTFSNVYIKASMDYYFQQDNVYYEFRNETPTPAYTLVNIGAGTNICSGKKTICSVYLVCNNLFDVAYQSNMSRLKYSDTNNTTGRVGVYNMGRNISLKVLIPIDVKK